MQISLSLKEASWRTLYKDGYPALDKVLKSRPILFLYDGHLYRGHYHTNGHFYSDDFGKDSVVVSHADYGHNQVTYWCYTDELVVNERTA